MTDAARSIRTLRSLSIVLLTLALGTSVRAQSSADELERRAQQVTTEINSQQSAGRFNAPAQLAAIQRLGQVAMGYIDLTDRAVRAGSEDKEKGALRAAYEAISAPLQRIYDSNSGKLEGQARGIMEQDGDLEALYETTEWRESQAVAAQALYYLNWLHSYGARLYDGARRKELLEKAERGFSEFAVGERGSELITESLLGRGLCHLELGNYDWAIRDFQLVADDKDVSTERRAKARMGLLDAAVRGGKIEQTIKLSQEMLAGESANSSLIRYYQVRALLNAAKANKGPKAADYRRQALASMDQLRKAGPGWQAKVDALMAAEVENPEEWAAPADSPAAKWSVARLLVQKGDYKAARPLLEAIVASKDAASARVQAEASYLLGLALFQAAEYQSAADQFTASLKGPPPAYAADAAYMRFKALEALIAKNPDGDTQGYEAAMKAYAADYPDHRSIYEGHYRLGEWLQARKQFADAIKQYEQVSGDPSFELRARFGAVQSRFEILQGNDAAKVTGQERTALIAAIGIDLQQFKTLAAEYERKGDKGAVPLADLRAKTAVMSAVYATITPEPHDEEALTDLAGFEKKYPDKSDLFPQVVRLRLGALQRLGRFADAEAEVTQHGAVLRTEGQADTIETLAAGFQKEGVRRKVKGDEAGGQAAQQVASRLYELVLADSDTSNRTKLTLAKLYEGADDYDKATALYTEILTTDANSLTALRGLARNAERQKNLAQALTLWQQLGKAVRPGDYPWYESAYEVARLTFAQGKRQPCCEQLNQLKPTMPGLGNPELREKLTRLYTEACE